MPEIIARTPAWYREPWPWLLMLGPLIVVLAGLYTAWLAIHTDDGLVADDYYKQGLAINKTLAEDARAKALQYRARIVFDATQGRLQIALSARDGAPLPAALRLRLVHPTIAGRNQVILLRGTAPGHYEGILGVSRPGRWLIMLEDTDASWRITGEWRGVEKSFALEAGQGS